LSDIAHFNSESIFETANRLADKAATTSSSYFRAGVDIDLKGDESPVTIADKQIEREARDHLEKAFPGHAILGEEYGSGDLSNDHVWIIDPIDGTRSFISGHPLYGFLLATRRTFHWSTRAGCDAQRAINLDVKQDEA